MHVTHFCFVVVVVVVVVFFYIYKLAMRHFSPENNSFFGGYTVYFVSV